MSPSSSMPFAHCGGMAGSVSSLSSIETQPGSNASINASPSLSTPSLHWLVTHVIVPAAHAEPASQVKCVSAGSQVSPIGIRPNTSSTYVPDEKLESTNTKYVSCAGAVTVATSPPPGVLAHATSAPVAHMPWCT